MKNWEKIMRTLRSQVAAITAVGMLASGMVVLSGTPANAAAGDPDTTFNQKVSAVNQTDDQMITSTAVQPDGKIIAVGRIETGPGNGISRYNADGTVDAAFNNQTRQLGVNATTWTVAVQADGKILAGGQFSVPAPGLLRLNADGAASEASAFLIRNLIGVDPNNGAVAVAERVRAGQNVQFHLREAAASQDEALGLLRAATADHPNDTVHFGLLMACMGRGQGLFGRADGDISLARQLIPDLPVAGAFCNGEIGPIGGTTHLHGYTACWGLLRPVDPASE